jgi:hypothetical protein
MLPPFPTYPRVRRKSHEVPAMTAALLDRPDSTLRLAPCPECADRRRTLVDSGDGLLGHCLGCGRMLPAPLATESLGGPARPGTAQGGGR